MILKIGRRNVQGIETKLFSSFDINEMFFVITEMQFLNN